MLRGRWIVGHILVVVVAAIFAALGFWQLARHHQKQDKVRAQQAAYSAPAPEIGTGDAQSGSRIQATGTYDGTHEVLLRDQVRGSNLGNDVLTPIRLADGTGVLVDRGWVATNSTIGGPPAGVVVVRGIARAPRALSAQDNLSTLDGRVSVPRVDIARLARDVPYRLRNVWIEAQSQQPPPAADAPKLPTPPPPDQVNHFQYALQWWAFALIPLIGWPIVLLRVRRRSERSTPGG